MSEAEGSDRRAPRPPSGAARPGPQGREGPGTSVSRSGRAPDGKAALFSAAQRTPMTLVVECSQCRARSRVSYVELTKRSLPTPVWLPWRQHARLARCPACEQRTWLAEHWRD